MASARPLLAGIALGLLLGAALPFALDSGGTKGALLGGAILAAMLLGLALLWPAAARAPHTPSAALPPAPLVTPAAPAPEAALPRAVDIEALGEPAVIVDPGQHVAAANAAARALLGARLVGTDVRVGLRHPVILDALAQARASSRPAQRELPGFARPDSVFQLRAARLADGRVLVSLRDMTQARLTERTRVDFVANASHELRTPLATLTGFIETLQGPAAEDEPARARFLNIMAQEARRMSRLIDDLLSLSRIELDKFVPPRTPVELAGALEDVARTLAVQLEADGRALLIDAAEDLPPVVADRDQLLQVLHNLLSNALKYGRTGTPIRISAERAAAPAPRSSGPVVRILVSDEGEGIATEHIPRLTERFYRVDNSRSRALGGTGLGLAIVKHIVERHRGELEIESRVGQGTTVCFTLPVAEGAAREEEEPAGSEEPFIGATAALS